jgi:hypothetical protein
VKQPQESEMPSTIRKVRVEMAALEIATIFAG